jgi:predicted MPP superfamily phosphohydrolase
VGLFSRCRAFGDRALPGVAAIGYTKLRSGRSCLPKAMDGKVLVALSDMHLGSQLGDRWLAARIARVKVQRPDLVVLLGDIFEGHGPLKIG